MIFPRAWQSGLTIAILLLPGAAALAANRTADPAPGPPPLLLAGGRSLAYVRTFSSEQEVQSKRSFLGRVLDFVVGAPDRRRMIRPYAVATDSRGRVLVADPGALLVHIFDFTRHKYQKLEGSRRDQFRSPIGIAVDSSDNVYVSDSELGKIFVYDARGKFRRYLGDVRGEGYFKRPTGLAVDSARRRLYVTDTLRDSVYILDLEGKILGHFGQRGDAAGEFNFPTEVVVRNDELIVVDAMNFRLQIFDTDGRFRTQFGRMGRQFGEMFRSKGLAVDSEGSLYLADAFLDAVQVFDREGRLLYYFGEQGEGARQFQLPAGVCIDAHDRVFVVDSFNRRVQQFQYFAATAAKEGGRP